MKMSRVDEDCASALYSKTKDRGRQTVREKKNVPNNLCVDCTEQTGFLVSYRTAVNIILYTNIMRRIHYDIIMCIYTQNSGYVHTTYIYTHKHTYNQKDLESTVKLIICHPV